VRVSRRFVTGSALPRGVDDLDIRFVGRYLAGAKARRRRRFRLRLPVRPHYRTCRCGDHHGGERRLGTCASSRYQSRKRNVDGQPLGHRGTADAWGCRATFGRANLLRLERSGGRTEFGIRSCAATELQTGTTWPEVDRSADSTPIDRESGTAGTDIKATAESRLTADPNSARTDLESAAIFAGADSDYGGLIGSTPLRGLSWSLFFWWPMPSPPSPESADAIPPPISRPAATNPTHAIKRRTGCVTIPTLPTKQLPPRQLSMRDYRIFAPISHQSIAQLTLLAIDAIRRIRHLLLCARQSCRYSVSFRRGAS
jgi:hypothetical protein